MKKLNIPSYSWLSLKENLIHAVQDLYGGINTSISPAQVSDVTSIGSNDIKNLSPGDIIVKVDGNKKYSYVVSYRDDVAGELSLVYTDHTNIIEVHYEKSGDTWGYTTTDTVTL